MKKIAFVIQDMFAQGAQYATALMVRGFIARGYEVDLIVSALHDKKLADGQTNVFEVPERTNWIHLKGLKGRQNLAELRRYLKSTDAEAVISMSTGYTHALRLAAAGLCRRPKLVHVEHSFAGITQDGEELPSVTKWSLHALMRWWYYKAFDRVFVVSHAGVDDFARMNPWYARSKIRVVNNPVIDDFFFQKKKCDPSHPWLMEKTTEWKTFVNAAALAPYKGQRYLLEAMKIIAGRGEKVRVVIFGQGLLEDEFKAYIKQNGLENYVSIPGYTKNFPAEANAAFGFVLPSLAESFGIVLVEALACGCKMVAFDCPFGPREILDNGKYGRLVAFKDSACLADAMIEASKDELSDNAEESWHRYTIDTAVEKYLKGLS